MTIQFLCPNGHQIRCPDEQAGRAAKCPKCGVKFRIPELSELEVSESDSDVSPPELENTEGGATRAPTEEIEFLCPNGHRLHGPATLQGRPGQCPECGSKFRIPSYDEVPDEEEEESEQQQISVGRMDGGVDSGLHLEEVAVQEKAVEESAAEEEAAGGPILQEVVDGARDSDIWKPLGPEAAPAADGPGLSAVLAELWSEKAQGAVVELHLSDGETIAPDRFSETLSGGRHGVFAVQDPDGTHTVVVVAWDSVARVLVRGVKELPEGMRE